VHRRAPPIPNAVAALLLEGDAVVWALVRGIGVPTCHARKIAGRAHEPDVKVFSTERLNERGLRAVLNRRALQSR